MSFLALAALLALPSSAAPEPSAVAASTAPAPAALPVSLDSSRIRLEANDAAGALADAEAVIARGGGADAYAARADAKRALGRPFDEVLADYAEAAKLDPSYLEKYKGLIAQRESEEHPEKNAGSTGLSGVPMGLIVGGGIVGALFVAGAVMLSRRQDDVAPDDEGVKPGGQKKAPEPAEGAAKDAGPSAKADATLAKADATLAKAEATLAKAEATIAKADAALAKAEDAPAKESDPPEKRPKKA